MTIGTTENSALGNLRTTGSVPEESLRGSRIAQELVDEVAARVYAMLQLELLVEQERCRLPFRNSFGGQGGW